MRRTGATILADEGCDFLILKKMKMTAFVPPAVAGVPQFVPTIPPAPPVASMGPTFNFNGSNNCIYVYMMPVGPQVVADERAVAPVGGAVAAPLAPLPAANLPPAGNV